MDYKKIISMSLYNRPTYTKTVLDALSNCVNIEQYKLVIFLEPGNDEVLKLVNSIDFAEVELHQNEKVLGCSPNIFRAIDRAFQQTSYNIHIEDDIVPAKDAILYWEWAREKYMNDKDIFTVTAYIKRSDEPKDEEMYQVGRHKAFVCWGWSTWEDRWKEIRSQWDFVNWDPKIDKEIRGERKQIFPYVARVQNIGAENGVHVPSPEWHRQYHFNEIWADNYNYELKSTFYEKDTSPQSNNR